MIRQSLAAFALAAFAAAGLAACQVDERPESAYRTPERGERLRAAVAAPTRTPANVARDRYRHPSETLSFFRIAPDDTVVEIWPGGGWYTEILAPYLRAGGGTYYAAGRTSDHEAMRRLMAASPGSYDGIRLAAFPAREAGDARVPDGSADLVLTFRNVHNWLGADPPWGEDAFRQMYAMLKPGGTLGVVEHRLPEDLAGVNESSSGYVRVSTVRRLAEAAGFRFDGAAEINANPLDDHDHPRGVWTLPPTLRLGDTDRDVYLAVGESDRMTLRFVKPE